MKLKTYLLTLALPVIAGTAFASDSAGNKVAYKIEMYNQTENQWFSPFLCALHHRRISLFEFGAPATTGLSTFAEDGFNGILAEELNNNYDVYAVLKTGPGLTPPGSSRIETIEAYAPANARLTCAAMPVTTNDVLTAVSSVELPNQINLTSVYTGTDWDIGSEVNNYSADSMPLDSINLVPHSPENAGTIPETVVFGDSGRPNGVPAKLNPFTRAFIDSAGQVVAEGYMSTFRYHGSQAFPADTYGWNGSASRLAVTRIDGGEGDSVCDYTHALQNEGWGWNSATQTSCAPL